MGENDTSVSLEELIRVEVLLNAKLHAGKPNAGAVLGKILGMKSGLRSRALEVKELVAAQVEEISKLSLDVISAELSDVAPDAVSSYQKQATIKSQERREQKKELPELQNAISGKFVVRYAPDPSKHPHIGQGMNYLINRLYADKYKGKVVLRFDDTNPAIVAPEYYDAIREGLTWIGATWDFEVRASDYLDEFYETSRDLIQKGLFYACTCEPSDLSEKKSEGIACTHRNFSSDESLEIFKKMISGNYQPGEAVIRLLGTMDSDNVVMRDPVMLRLVQDQHPMLDQFHPVFPTYDFESACLEVKFGITHIIRSGEFGTMRKELQSHLINLLGGSVPEFVSFGRFNIQGSPTKGRVIRDLVQRGVVSGWDDIRLLTLIGLKQRGIHPGTLRHLIHEAGLTPKNTQIAWQTLEAKSKLLLEPEAKRYFFVKDPVKLEVTDGPTQELSLAIHPDHPEFGNRVFHIDGMFYLATADATKFVEGQTFRLKDLYNVTVESVTSEQISGRYHGTEVIPSIPKIHWVTSDYIIGKLMIPSLLEKKRGEIDEDSLKQVGGFFESSINQLDETSIVQLERFGYAKIMFENDNITGHVVHLH
ncbi:MAG: glutamate--tRNA ligase family protein [Candidatus Kariarchaeaceae archaeon]|jgi:glutamyl-tRNA synthetase